MSLPDRPARRNRGVRPALWGIAAAALYVGVVAWTHSVGDVLPLVLFDGLAPPVRYNWVRPPAPLARGNNAATSGAGKVVFEGTGSPNALVYTDDAQALISFAPNTVAPRPGETAANVWITPLDPDTLTPPPRGLRFDGNAYEFRVEYASSGDPAPLQRAVSIILRYATGTTQILHLTGATWRQVPSNDFPAALQRTFEVRTLGVFVPAAPADLPYAHRISMWLYAGVGAAVLGLAALVAWTIRAGRQGDSGGRWRKKWRR